jgi:hypothetical protein
VTTTVLTTTGGTLWSAAERCRQFLEAMAAELDLNKPGIRVSCRHSRTASNGCCQSVLFVTCLCKCGFCPKAAMCASLLHRSPLLLKFPRVAAANYCWFSSIALLGSTLFCMDL